MRVPREPVLLTVLTGVAVWLSFYWGLLVVAWWWWLTGLLGWATVMAWRQWWSEWSERSTSVPIS